jgi:hypothetical protein
LSTHARFDYFFLDENCSLQLLALVEAVKPEWRLTSNFSLYAMPIETIKRLEMVGAIADFELHRSSREVALASFEKLTEGQKTLYLDVQYRVKTNETIPDLNAYPAVALAVYDWSRYLQFKEKDFEATLDERQLTLLDQIAASGFRPSPDDLSSQKADNPLESHGPYRLGIFANIPGWSEKSTPHQSLTLRVSPAAHRLGDVSTGMPKYSEVSVGEVIFKSEMTRTSHRPVSSLERLQVISIKNLYPGDILEATLPFEASIAVENSELKAGNRALSGAALVGKSREFASGALAYVLVGTQLAADNQNVRIGVLSKCGLIAESSHHHRLLMAVQALRDLDYSKTDWYQKFTTEGHFNLSKNRDLVAQYQRSFSGARVDFESILVGTFIFW